MRVVDYGKSMYGGWYANYHKDGKWGGCHADTLKDLKAKLDKALGQKMWTLGTRFDN